MPLRKRCKTIKHNAQRLDPLGVYLCFGLLRVCDQCGAVVFCEGPVEAADGGITDSGSDGFHGCTLLFDKSGCFFHPQLQNQLMIGNAHAAVDDPADLFFTVMESFRKLC